MRKVWTIKDILNFILWYLRDRIDDNSEYILTIKKKKKTRTLPQNKMFHVLFSLISKEEIKLWNEENDEEKIKHIMKCALIWVKEVWVWKFKTVYPKKWTSDLTDQEWIKFIEKMIEWCNTRYDLKITWADDPKLLEYYDKYLQ